MQRLRCQRCSKELRKGSLKYVIEIRSFADFDGYLEDYEGNVDEGINELLDLMDTMDTKTLEEDVFREQIHILCKSCMERFSKNPFNRESEIFEEDVKSTIH